MRSGEVIAPENGGKNELSSRTHAADNAVASPRNDLCGVDVSQPSQRLEALQQSCFGGDGHVFQVVVGELPGLKGVLRSNTSNGKG